MIQEIEVRAKIAAVLNESISLADFSRWIVDQSWNMHQDSSPVAIDLVSDIQALIAEHDDSSLNDAQFLAALKSMAAPSEFRIKINVVVRPNAAASSLHVRLKNGFGIRTGASEVPSFSKAIPLPQPV